MKRILFIERNLTLGPISLVLIQMNFWPSCLFGWRCRRGVSVHNTVAVIGIRKALLIGENEDNFTWIFFGLGNVLSLYSILGLLSSDKKNETEYKEIHFNLHENESSGMNKHLLNVPIWRFYFHDENDESCTNLTLK